MIMHRHIADWHGKPLVERDGHRIGKLVDNKGDEPMFGTVEEGVVDRHLTFVPLGGSTIGPDNVQLATDPSSLYYHYQLTYNPPDTDSGRLARR